jgi:hypothetical protein
VAAAPTRATPPAIHDRPYMCSAMRRGPIKCSESFEPVPVQPFAARTFLLLNAAYRVFSFYISMSTGRGFVVVNKCLIGSPRRAPADGFLELSALASSAREGIGWLRVAAW